MRNVIENLWVQQIYHQQIERSKMIYRLLPHKMNVKSCTAYMYPARTRNERVSTRTLRKSLLIDESSVIRVIHLFIFSLLCRTIDWFHWLDGQRTLTISSHTTANSICILCTYSRCVHFLINQSVFVNMYTSGIFMSLCSFVWNAMTIWPIIKAQSMECRRQGAHNSIINDIIFGCKFICK